MTARLLAFVIWAAVAATVVFWGLRLLVRSPSAPAHAVVSATPAQGADVTRVLGSAPPASQAPPEAANSRFRLVGVVAPRQAGDSRMGVALIQVDDKPARAFRVGATVDEGLTVQAVHRRGVSLGPSGAPPQVQLELPPPTAAATGTLPRSTSAAPLPPGAAPPPSQGLTRRPPSRRLPPQAAAPPAPQAPPPAPAPGAVTAPQPMPSNPPQPGQQVPTQQ